MKERPTAAGGEASVEELYRRHAGEAQRVARSITHGTNDTSGLGRDVSHGCIRMSNDGITLLARTLPLGVPVEILP